MSKTPEELAEEYTKDWWGNLPEAEGMRKSARENFLAGYKTAAAEYQEKLNQMRLERPAFKKHEIENLLSQANADGYKRGFERGLIAQNCWISVKNRLPEQDMQILAWSGGLGDIPPFCTGGYELWNWSIKFSPNDCRLTGITYWMPLPEPPKEDK
jgi:hypothetical protein